MKLDNFAMSMHNVCPAKYELRINQGWAPRRKSAALGAGGAAHAGLAEWYRTGGNLNDTLDAIRLAWPPEHPLDDYRDLSKVLSVMTEYSKRYPSEDWTVIGWPEHPLIEHPFSLLLTDDSGSPVLTDDGDEIWYGGILDGAISWMGQVYVLEHKTTSQLGEYYFNQFKPNNQVDGYVWALSVLTGKPVVGALINAIGMYRVGKTKFEREITSRTQASVAEWISNVQATASEIEWHAKRGVWPLRKTSCTQYGKCEFHGLHTIDNPKDRQRLLETDFVIEQWDYERREGNA